MENKNYNIPCPIIDIREEESCKLLTKRYEEMTQPTLINKAGKKIVEIVPDNVKELCTEVGLNLQQLAVYKQTLNVIAESFHLIEQEAARFTLSADSVIKQVNEIAFENRITDINEICLIRSYKIQKLVENYKRMDSLFAIIEGGGLGVIGFVGLPFNIVLSTFLYYRAVQSVAMLYGYDVKNNPDELIIASEVFINALDPYNAGNTGEINDIICKIMIMANLNCIKQVVNKGWQAMAERGGLALLAVQLRACANQAAKKALNKAGAKQLENELFQDVYTQVGKKLTQDTIKKSIPVIGAVIGACFDLSQIRKIIDFANIFYHKRFLVEKEMRIQMLLSNCSFVMDTEYEIHDDNKTDE